MKTPTIGLMNYLPLLHKGTFAIIDQGLFAGTNFLVYILLARWLTPSQYGSFAVAFSIFLFFGALYTAIIIEPMLIFGPSRYAAKQGKYIAVLTYMHICLTLPLGLLLMLVAVLLGHIYTIEVKNAMIGLAIASPMILLLWLVRRAFYVRFQPAWSALGGLLYLGLFLGIINFVHNLGKLTQATAFLVMGFSAFTVVIVLLPILAPQWRMIGNPAPSEIVKEHWRYGRWALGTASLAWIPSNIYYVILPAIVGLSGVATMRALMNLALPMQHAIAALSVLILPVLSRTLHARGILGMTSRVKVFGAVLLSVSCLYYVVLLGFNVEILNLLYANQYHEFAYLIPIIGLVPIIGSITGILGSALRATERPDRILMCYMASSSVALTIGIALALSLGIKGAIISLILSSVTTAGGLFFFFRKLSIRS